MSKWDQIRGNDEEDSQDWLLTYADMISLLLGFFIIMFSISSIDEEQLQELSESLSETFQGEEQDKQSESNLGFDSETRRLKALELLIAMLSLGQPDQAVKTIEKLAARANEDKETLEELDKELTQLATSHGIDLGKKREDLTVDLNLPSYAFFKPGSAELIPSAREKIKTLVNTITDYKDIAAVEVRGHTDSRLPSRSAHFKSNWSLSAARAGTVAQELIKSGFDRKMIKTSGVADLEPLFPEYYSSGRPNRGNMAKNRRVQIVIRRKRSD